MTPGLRLLSVAGSDPTGGAGIQADLATFAALGARGLSVVTAVTVQDTTGVSAVYPLPPDVVTAQMRAVVTDIGCDAIKIGMLATAACARAVAVVLDEVPEIPVVLDPVLVSSSGAELLAGDAVEVLWALWPRARVSTPNWPEAAALLAGSVATAAQADAAARELAARGGHAVLLSGGHGDGDVVEDRLAVDGDLIRFRGPRLAGRFHGTGCALSSAVAVGLARGRSERQAAAEAVAYVQRAMHGAQRAGRGARLLDLFAGIDRREGI